MHAHTLPGLKHHLMTPRVRGPRPPWANAPPCLGIKGAQLLLACALKSRAAQPGGVRAHGPHAHKAAASELERVWWSAWIPLAALSPIPCAPKPTDLPLKRNAIWGSVPIWNGTTRHGRHARSLVATRAPSADVLCVVNELLGYLYRILGVLAQVLVLEHRIRQSVSATAGRVSRITTWRVHGAHVRRPVALMVPERGACSA